MLSFGKSSWSQYYNSFPSGFPCYHEHRLPAIDLQLWQVLGVSNLWVFFLFSFSASARGWQLSVPFQSPLRPEAPPTLAVPELEYVTSGIPKWLHPPWLMGLTGSLCWRRAWRWAGSPSQSWWGGCGCCEDLSLQWGQVWLNHASISLAGNVLRDFCHSRAVRHQPELCPGDCKSGPWSVNLNGSEA